MAAKSPNKTPSKSLDVYRVCGEPHQFLRNKQNVFLGKSLLVRLDYTLALEDLIRPVTLNDGFSKAVYVAPVMLKRK